MRFAHISTLLAALLQRTLAAPYSFPNATGTTNNTLNETSGGPYVCQTVYPTDLSIINSRYPDYDAAPLHQSSRFFMLRRQRIDDGEIATRVRFHGLPAKDSNKSCRLEFILPDPGLQKIQGINPTFNVYQVEREVDDIATWNTHKDHDEGVLFGQFNGEPEAINKTRSVGGVAAIGSTACSESLTFQMDMAYDGPHLPNYWEFPNVAPPAWPVQGFRVVYGC